MTTSVTASSRLISAGAVMAAGTALSRVVGFVRVALLAFVLGNDTRQADMFGIANSVPNMIYILLAGGVLNTVFVPQVVRAMTHDEDGGEAYTNRLLTVGLLGLGLVTVVTTVAAPVIIWIYSGADWKSPALASQYQSMILLAFLCLPQIFFYGANVLMGQVLNAREKFGPMMFSPVANNLISIAVLVVYLVLWPQRGDHGTAFSTGQALLLGLGSTAGIIAQATVLVPFLRRAGFRYRPRFDFAHTGLGRTARLARWTLLYVLVTQLAVVVVTKIATSATATGRGAGWTVYNNAYLLWILPHSLITVSLATAMLPSASALAARGDLAGVRDETVRTMRLAVTALLPAAVGYLALAGPLTGLLFGNGSGARGAPLVGSTLVALAIGLVPFTCQYICLRSFYALEDTRTPFLVQLVIGSLNIVLAVVLTTAVNRPTLTAAMLGLAYSLSYLAGLALSVRLLGRRLGGLGGPSVPRLCLRLLFDALPAAVAAWGLTRLVATWTGALGAQLLALAGAGLLAVGLFLVCARLLAISEVTAILANLTDSLLRRRSKGPGAVAVGASSSASAREGGSSPTIGTTAATGPAGETTTVAAAERVVDPAPPVVSGVEEGPGMTDVDVRETALGTELDRELDQDPDDPSERSPGAPARPVAHPAPRLPAGTVLVDRYRLEDILAFSEPTVTWRAFDLTLSRSVLVHLLPSADDRAPRLLAAARRAAVATDSRFLRVLDAVEGAELPGTSDRTSYIVSEYAVGHSLQTLLGSGPLTGLEIAWVVREVADAIAGVHAVGLHHGRISPDTVVITPSGNVKIVGLLIEAAMRPAMSRAARPGGDDATGPEDATRSADPRAADVLDLGRLLYAGLVARWPGGPAYGLPDAPADGQTWMTPRQVRAGVSPALDRTCDQLLGQPPRHHAQPLQSCSELVAALHRTLGSADASGDLERRLRQPVPKVGGRPVGSWGDGSDAGTVSAAFRGEPEAGSRGVTVSTVSRAAGSRLPTAGAAPVARTSPTSPTGPSSPTSPRSPGGPRPAAPSTAPADPTPRSRRWIAVAVVLLLMIATVALALKLGSGGRVVATPGPDPSTAPTRSSTRAPAAGPLTIAGARDFDPQGDDRTVNPGEVMYAFDGDPTTRWRTVQYLGNPKLGGIKDGVGIVLDLGQARTIGSVDLRLSGRGTDLQIRVPRTDPSGTTTPPMGSADRWRPVGKADGAGRTVSVGLASGSAAVTTRFVLVYLTSLPKEGNNYRGGIYEVQVLS